MRASTRCFSRFLAMVCAALILSRLGETLDVLDLPRRSVCCGKPRLSLLTLAVLLCGRLWLYVSRNRWLCNGCVLLALCLTLGPTRLISSEYVPRGRALSSAPTGSASRALREKTLASPGSPAIIIT